jgi:hypothetical protein
MEAQEVEQRKLWNNFVRSLMETESAWDKFRSEVQVDLLF